MGLAKALMKVRRPPSFAASSPGQATPCSSVSPSLLDQSPSEVKGAPARTPWLPVMALVPAEIIIAPLDCREGKCKCLKRQASSEMSDGTRWPPARWQVCSSPTGGGRPSATAACGQADSRPQTAGGSQGPEKSNAQSFW